MLLPAAELALHELKDRVGMPDAQCGRWPWGEPGNPVMTLSWRSGDGIGRNIHVAICLEWVNPGILIEGNAWKEGASPGEEGAVWNAQWGQINGVAQVPAATLEHELGRFVAEAYD